MGGRGASSGIDYNREYGSEYRTVLEYENIKFVKINDGKATSAPMETRGKNRIYVTVNKNDIIKHITYYDIDGKRTRQVDINGRAHKGMKEHTHMGYEHEEYGTRAIAPSEQELIDLVTDLWNNRDKSI